MNTQDKVHLTREGFEEIKEELKRLQEKEPEAIDRVARARDFGDLSENSEYHAAREDLSFIKGRIDELEDLLSRVEIIENQSSDQVDLGCKVTVNTEDGNEMTFVVVGEYEADPIKRKISPDSPLGKALIGRKVNEKVEFEAPVGKVIYTIKKIH